MNTLVTALQIAIPLSFVSLVVGVISLRSGGGGNEIHDPMEMAFLGGGPGRVAETAIVAMHTDGRLRVGGPGIVALHSDIARNPVEHAVVQEYRRAPNGALHALRLAVMRSPAVQEIGHSLAARGLLVPVRKTRLWVLWGVTQAVVCVLAIPLSIVLLVSTTDPAVIPTLPLAFIGVFAGVICAVVARQRLTAAGVKARLKFRTAYQHIRTPAHQVAVNGHMALDDPQLRDHLTAARAMRAGRDFQPAPHLAAGAVVVWCASAGFGDGSGSGDGGGGCGGSGGSGCGGGGGGCGGGGGSGDGGGGGGGGGCGGGGGGCGGGGG
ncbi:TIGR04222 domain-containing membrane protein [Streptomyces sp. NBC_01498]|uniref:TIGR04222 domain-containing membrane protein n=1 Tax=Streptomyces sp. NBC_01498 TaxID=2975870 RepID=UPI002E7AF640|nr:TIGR04222 domain-containing membrane protein [Streptomyces sp. NBC_01498]WTL24100.1 TIGR04222 domain-containing membrane protein [Streptomyces sp. NBC_01498]